MLTIQVIGGVGQASSLVVLAAYRRQNASARRACERAFRVETVRKLAGWTSAPREPIANGREQLKIKKLNT